MRVRGYTGRQSNFNLIRQTKLDERLFRVTTKHDFMLGEFPQDTQEKFDISYDESAPSIRTDHR